MAFGKIMVMSKLTLRYADLAFYGRLRGFWQNRCNGFGAGWVFHKWTGDVPPNVDAFAPTISFAADRPRVLVAEFEPTNPGTIIMMQ